MLDMIEDCITPINLNANLQLDLPGKLNDMVSQFFDDHDKNNKTIW